MADDQGYGDVGPRILSVIYF